LEFSACLEDFPFAGNLNAGSGVVEGGFKFFEKFDDS
jgi:hypothetical protein